MFDMRGHQSLCMISLFYITAYFHVSIQPMREPRQLEKYKWRKCSCLRWKSVSGLSIVHSEAFVLGCSVLLALCLKLKLKLKLPESPLIWVLLLFLASEAGQPGTDQHGCSCARTGAVIRPADLTRTCTHTHTHAWNKELNSPLSPPLLTN